MLRRTCLHILITALLAGCIGRRGVEIHWKDGNYLVYTRPDSEEIIMGYSMGDDGILGMSEETVVAAGSDSRHVVFKRQATSGKVEHFYIRKEAGGEGGVFGPFGVEEYNRMSSAIPLPGYTWHLKR